ncbi:hypothetical protein cand_021510 [Cryptosporidium andersoni]|uniref:Uncharacterized protein n=1 Tax=Cryptosporidium andersoni TaxID=117008 RepID=A0A1J4MSE7_9CRYT|nr:hypothetical protein cand_021510 [Cryptosporidium andersoni]
MENEIKSKNLFNQVIQELKLKNVVFKEDKSHYKFNYNNASISKLSQIDQVSIKLENVQLSEYDDAEYKDEFYKDNILTKSESIYINSSKYEKYSDPSFKSAKIKYPVVYPYPMTYVSQSLPSPPKQHTLRKTGINLIEEEYICPKLSTEESLISSKNFIIPEYLGSKSKFELNRYNQKSFKFNSKKKNCKPGTQLFAHIKPLEICHKGSLYSIKTETYDSNNENTCNDLGNLQKDESFESIDKYNIFEKQIKNKQENSICESKNRSNNETMNHVVDRLLEPDKSVNNTCLIYKLQSEHTHTRHRPLYNSKHIENLDRYFDISKVKQERKESQPIDYPNQTKFKNISSSVKNIYSYKIDNLVDQGVVSDLCEEARISIPPLPLAPLPNLIEPTTNYNNIGKIPKAIFKPTVVTSRHEVMAQLLDIAW